MTPEEFKEKMKNIWDKYDEEDGHDLADRLMCDVLRQLGYGEGVEIFEEADKWYS